MVMLWYRALNKYYMTRPIGRQSIKSSGRLCIGELFGLVPSPGPLFTTEKGASPFGEFEVQKLGVFTW